jgi:hypothetical protein
MANKTLFASLMGALIPKTDTLNSENAPAYSLTPKQVVFDERPSAFVKVSTLFS